MAIPDFQAVMLPLLEALADGQERTGRDVTAVLAQQFGLTEEEQKMLLPSGQQSVFGNRVGWAKSHLKHAGLLENPKWGRIRISDAGRQVLDQKPAAIDVKFLCQFPSYLEFRGKSGEGNGKPVWTSLPPEDPKTPQERLDEAFETLRQTAKEDLLARLKVCSPPFFEKAVVKLLLAMGYGGVAGDGRVTGQPGDGGIDGVIREDKLGLDIVCVQAKRWDSTVGRPVVQGFVGSMDYIRAKKGVILTTSAFTKEARDFVDRIEGKKVVLIDGEQLAELMITHNVGVTVTEVYEVKEVSIDFFNEDEV